MAEHLSLVPPGNVDLPSIPREIDPVATFNALVSWVHDELIVKQKAPGFVIGISGTDSILAFLVCAEAFKRAGRPDRVVGIHYGDQLQSDGQPAKVIASDAQPNVCGTDYDPWFQKTIIPWLKERAPEAKIIVDSSINHNSDSHRWAALMDYSILKNPQTGAMLPPGENFWVVGTRTATEKAFGSYSNISNLASIQPLDSLWKSEVLKICAAPFLDVHEDALVKSRLPDCVCGRFELPAINIESVDALLMVRAGQLSPRYVEENIPADLRRQLNQFLDEQIAHTQFKKQIPYIPDAAYVKTSPEVDREVLTRAKQSAEGLSDDTKSISEIVPYIIKTGHANAACDLVCTSSENRSAWLPEALTLFNTPGLRGQQRRLMLEKVFSGDVPIVMAGGLARCSARIGNYGFSFPRWRYFTQRSGEEPSLVEQFGMQRLNRDTDIRDAALPPSDPNRDLLGMGFVWNDDKWHIEYRRAYIVCSNRSEEGPATIIIRNNSYYFGRDRLPAPVYVSWEKLSPEDLQAITVDTLQNSGRFITWDNFLQSAPDMALKEKVRRVDGLLGYLDDFDAGLNQWLRSSGPTDRKNGAGPDHSASNEEGGFRHLISFLRQKASNPSINAKPVFIGKIVDHTPPWFPESAIALTPKLVDQLEKSGDAGSSMVLLTGENGDFPVVADKGTQIRLAKARVVHDNPR